MLPGSGVPSQQDPAVWVALSSTRPAARALSPVPSSCTVQLSAGPSNPRLSQVQISGPVYQVTKPKLLSISLEKEIGCQETLSNIKSLYFQTTVSPSSLNLLAPLKFMSSDYTIYYIPQLFMSPTDLERYSPSIFINT